MASQNCGSFHRRLDRGITVFFWLEWGVSIISGRLHPDFIIWLIAVIAIFLQSSFPSVQGVQSSPHVFSPADGHRARQKLTFSSLWPLTASADRSRPQSCCRSTWKARSTFWTTSPVMAFTRPPWFGPFGCWNAGGSGTQVPKKNGSSCWTCEDWNSGHFISWSLKAQEKTCLNLQFVLKSVAQPSQPFQHPESTPCDDLFPFFGVSSPHETWAETTETWDFCIFFVTCIVASPRSLSRNRSWKAIHCCTPPKALCESHWFAIGLPIFFLVLHLARSTTGARPTARASSASGSSAWPPTPRWHGSWSNTHAAVWMPWRSPMGPHTPRRQGPPGQRADGDGVWRCLRCLEWIWGFKNDLNVCNVNVWMEWGHV